MLSGKRGSGGPGGPVGIRNFPVHGPIGVVIVSLVNVFLISSGHILTMQKWCHELNTVQIESVTFDDVMRITGPGKAAAADDIHPSDVAGHKRCWNDHSVRPAAIRMLVDAPRADISTAKTDPD